MCLAIPGKITEINDTTAIVDIMGNSIKADVSLVTDPKIGDYVIVHTGMAIAIIDEEEARMTIELMQEINEEMGVV